MSADEPREFIIDCLTDPFNAEKQAALGQWLQHAEANRTLFAETKLLWDAAEHIPAQPFNVMQGWQALSQEISGSSTAHVVELKREKVSSTREEAPAVTAPFFSRIRRIRRPFIAAACIPLVLMLSLIIRKQTRHTVRWTSVLASTRDSLLMPDGSFILMQAGTSLSYPEGWPERTVKLEKGEAFFTVAKDAQRTFTVQLPRSVVTVLGTSFDVNTSSQKSEVVVWEGMVSLATINSSVVLTKGEMGQINNITGSLVKPTGNFAYRCGWANGQLVFENEDAGTVAAVLSDYYHQRFTLPDSSLANRKITVSFRHQSPKDVQAVLNAVLEQ